MSLFPETIQAKLEGRTVRMAWLLFLDFDGEPMRIWGGFGTLDAGGEDWLGIGNAGSIQGLEQAVNGQAPETTLTLSGIDADIVRLTRDEFSEKAIDRRVVVYIQFLNEEDDRVLDLYDEPYPIWSGLMKTAAFMLTGAERKITVTVESLFSLRSRPVFGMYTDADQQARFAGDLGFQFVPTLRNKVVTWPDF